MMKKRYLILGLVSIIGFMGCEEQKDIFLEDEFLAYVNEFKEQAMDRGLALDQEFSELSIVFSQVANDAVGQCVTFTSGAREIRILESNWRDLEFYERELLIFHELGHCALNRDHINSSAQGRCLSIMRESNSVCRINYNVETKSDYLDELFK